MTTSKQIIAIAELDGWYQNKEDKLWYHETKWPNKDSGQTQPPLTVQCGQYLTSRDAIVPVIEKQKLGVQIGVVSAVYQMRCITSGEEWNNEDVVEIMLATPSQLAEALLRATGKWSEE